VLIADAGFDGMVVQIAIKGSGFRVQGSGSGLSEISIGAGEDWDEFVAWCVENDLAGVECLSGIPGTVGGTPVQNVGAYGQEVSETIKSVRCLDRRTGEFVVLPNADCGFSYRRSIFNTTERDRYIVTAVTFALMKDGEPKIAYPELEKAMHSSIHARWASETLKGDQIVSADPSWLFRSLDYVRYIILGLRAAKSMVIDKADPNSRSAGSFFKNPIVERNVFDELKAQYPDLPSFPAGDALVKIPAAWLIEHAGFNKGYTLGNAGISSNHTLALINCGGATAVEVIALKDAVQAGVSARFGIDLFPEPLLIGFD
ncbi:MAG: UDP-N-acetylmuramate dehydrogenase, partial [Pyrinomonadaceae bacterium]|nr:UDP-N-acetylmuramate dehydrogenase [Pyrinomonadaceae bacterium]